MIQTKSSLTGHISTKGTLTGNLNNAIIEKYPELEDIEITPSNEEQHFKSEKYGFDNILVKAIQTEEKIVTLDFSDADAIEIVPTEGKFLKKIVINKDVNLIPENISKDVMIFGVVGTLEEIETATYEFLDYLSLQSSSALSLGITINTSYTYKLKFKDTNVSSWEAYIGCKTVKTFACRDATNTYFNYYRGKGDLTTIPVEEPGELSFNFYSGAGSEIVLGTTYGSDVAKASFDIYHFEVYDSSGNLINSFKPVKLISTGEVGLLDEVNDNFIIYDV